MTAAGATLAGRRLAESMMNDSCTITRRAASAGQDEATGREIHPPPASVYAGACRVQLEQVQADHPEVGERALTVLKATISIPVAVTTVRVGDDVTVTGSQLDSSLVGRVWKVRAVAHKTFLTARRLDCWEVTG